MPEGIKFAFIEGGKFMVFEDGRIFKLLDPPVSSGGYKFVRIGEKSLPLHRVIASVFIPNPKNKPEVNHIDGNKTNNAAQNLEWVTRKENAKHAGEHGLCGKNLGRDKSEAQRQRRLNEASLITEKDNDPNAKNKIRFYRKKAGFSQTALALALGINQSAISQWENGDVEPTLDNLRKVADILGVKPGDLF